jgi:hypothetical protein
MTEVLAPSDGAARRRAAERRALLFNILTRLPERLVGSSLLFIYRVDRLL